MERNSIKKLIQEELKRIPRGGSGSAQNELRMVYKMMRQHGLSQNSQQSPTQVFKEAVEKIRKDHPEFKPNVTDRHYFGWPESE